MHVRALTWTRTENSSQYLPGQLSQACTQVG